MLVSLIPVAISLVSATTVRIEQILQTTSRYYVICVNNTANKFVFRVISRKSRIDLTSHDPVTENPQKNVYAEQFY